MTDYSKQIIEAYAKTGLKLREWMDGEKVYRLVVFEGAVWREWRGEWNQHGPWEMDECMARDIANEILRQVGEDLDEAGVEAHYNDEMKFWWCMQHTCILNTDGRFDAMADSATLAEFPTRWQAMLAAKVVIEKEKT